MLAKLAVALKPILLPLVRVLNRFLRRLVIASHHLEFHLIWRTGSKGPEWFDHYLDAYWAWPESGNALYMERGALGHFAIKENDRVLDMCCGDGFYARYFWSPRAREVVGIDVDAEALEYARQRNPADNVSYVLGSVLDGLPDGPFDVITWNASIEHFDEAEIRSVVRKAIDALTPAGVLVGTTIIQLDAGTYHWHKREFADKQDLAGFLAQEFSYVTVVESPHLNRTELLFYASNSPTRLPFNKGNEACLVIEGAPEPAV